VTIARTARAERGNIASEEVKRLVVGGAEAGERERAADVHWYLYDSRPRHCARTWGQNQHDGGSEDEKSRAEIAINPRLGGPTCEGGRFE